MARNDDIRSVSIATALDLIQKSKDPAKLDRQLSALAVATNKATSKRKGK